SPFDLLQRGIIFARIFARGGAAFLAVESRYVARRPSCRIRQSVASITAGLFLDTDCTQGFMMPAFHRET
ncbi:MAG: hypothetical protein ACTHL1_08065, partial [Burkholderiaceae bacterium]